MLLRYTTPNSQPLTAVLVRLMLDEQRFMDMAKVGWECVHGAEFCKGC